ncbi:class I SAM-dependent methyltransferase [Sphingobium amiense]|uniref:Class I SAM-dependent methyltransferase n=2 Tax=Sphingobium amiense TaxID=135719 RepID=A0A494W9A5_9SPHN|nr:class I SAM-dependent methyltransferase [Sphingobium amiense]
MPNTTEIVRDHYQSGTASADPVGDVMLSLDRSRAVSRAIDLAPLDQFHAGGAAATIELADLLAPAKGARLLDAGAGLGGPARLIAERFGVHVTGIDLTPSYVDLANRLASRTDLADQVTYQVGDLLDMPFHGASFDGAYTQHVVMNIKDRSRLYTEIRRVLKPGAAFAFHDVIASGTGEHPIYPTPWADSQMSSFLLDEGETTAVLLGANLRLEIWEDVTKSSIEAIGAVIASKPVGPSLASVMGPRFPLMAQNYARNLREGRLRVVMGRARAF